MFGKFGERWGFGETPRFKTEDLIAFSKKLVDVGGAVTWDVPIQRDGSIAAVFVDQLSAIGKALANYQPALSTRPTSRPAADE